MPAVLIGIVQCPLLQLKRGIPVVVPAAQIWSYEKDKEPVARGKLCCEAFMSNDKGEPMPLIEANNLIGKNDCHITIKVKNGCMLPTGMMDMHVKYRFGWEKHITETKRDP